MNTRVNIHCMPRFDAAVDEICDGSRGAFRHALQTPHLTFGQDIRGDSYLHAVETLEHEIHRDEIVLPDRGPEHFQQTFRNRLIFPQPDSGQGPSKEGLLRWLQILKVLHVALLLQVVVPLLRHFVRELPETPEHLNQLVDLHARGAAQAPVL